MVRAGLQLSVFRIRISKGLRIEFEYQKCQGGGAHPGEGGGGRPGEKSQQKLLWGFD